MKNKLMYFIVAISLILMPITINAEESLEIKCPSSKINKNESMTCEVIANSDEKITNVGFSVNTKGLELVSIDRANLWESETIYKNSLSVMASDFKESGTRVCFLKLKKASSNDVSDIVLKNIVVGTKVDGALVSNDVEDVTLSLGDTTSSSISNSSNNTVYIAFGIAAVVVIVIVAAITLKNKKKK